MYALKPILLARWLTWRKWYIYVSYASEVGEACSVLVPPGSHREKVYEAGMGSGDLSMLASIAVVLARILAATFRFYLPSVLL